MKFDYERDYAEQKRKILVLWEEMIIRIFGDKPNNPVHITDKTEIINTLNSIGKDKALNHVFLPSGGGLDLRRTVPSNESGLVELQFDGSPEIVNPESLTFYQFGDNPEWWYFRLNTLPFEPSGIYEIEVENEPTYKSVLEREIEEEMKYIGEELVEITPGQYINRSFWDIGYTGHDEYGNEIPLPPNARVVSRKYNGGAYVIFPKFSAYNNVPSTYDARHNKVSAEQFEQYIKKIVEALEK